MRNKLGACSWIFGDADYIKVAQAWKAAGLDGVEFNPTIGTSSAKDVRTTFSDQGLEVFSLTPPDADISSPDAAVRQAAIDTYFKLVDFAAEVEAPILSCHGLVGRIRPISTQEEEDDLLVQSVASIVDRAAEQNIDVVFEVLNRYETHQIRNCNEALDLVEKINLKNFSILLDAYHMNIEESNPARALLEAKSYLGLYHLADSNREAPGRGHSDLTLQLNTLGEINYTKPIILEINAPGPDPFSPMKTGDYQDVVSTYLSESVAYLKGYSKKEAA